MAMFRCWPGRTSSSAQSLATLLISIKTQAIDHILQPLRSRLIAPRITWRKRAGGDLLVCSEGSTFTNTNTDTNTNAKANSNTETKMWMPASSTHVVEE